MPNAAKMDGLVTDQKRDHGGGVDAAVTRFGGERIGWIDLSTGINPHPFPVPPLDPDAWTALPDQGAMDRLVAAARDFWQVPDGAAILAAPGASSLIAQIPSLLPASRVAIPSPTYNEHAAAFANDGWEIAEQSAEAQVVVHPNNPDGRLWSPKTLPVTHARLTVIDESFCDIAPAQSCIAMAARPDTLILKSFGKFWGLAGLRLGFAIGDATLVSHLREKLGPWAVSGPALHIGAAALRDTVWAEQTRHRLAQDSARLDALLERAGATVVGGTSLFRLYDVGDAMSWQTRLAQQHIWSRVFPYNPKWLRLGIPGQAHWTRLEDALA